MGPLANLRIVEFAGIGPGPFCAMLLAELGAKVIRIERKEASGLGVPKPPRYDLLLRGRKAFALDLKRDEGVEAALRLVDKADALIEGFRPGVMERLGLGPEALLARNPRLVYGRMTGWGQDGPLALAAGHDLNYIAIGGALHSIGRPGAPPSPPLNLVGDYAGGLYLAFGIVSAILSARESGVGQVVDAAVCDASAHLMTSFFGQAAAGVFSAERGTNVVDGGAPYYDVYECKDGRYASVAAIEPKFFAELLRRLGLEASTFPAQNDRSRWSEARRILASTFKTRSRDEWSELLQSSSVRASRRCSHWRKRQATLISRRGRPSSILTASSSLAPPHASRPRLPIRHRRPRPTGFIRPRRRLRDGWTTMKWRRCGNRERSTEFPRTRAT